MDDDAHAEPSVAEAARTDSWLPTRIRGAETFLGGGRVFNLPFLTTLVLIGLPAMWVLYTIGFLWSSRRWSEDDTERAER